MNDIAAIKVCQFSESRIQNFKQALVYAALNEYCYYRVEDQIIEYEKRLKKMINDKEFECYIFHRDKFLQVRAFIKELDEYDDGRYRKDFPINHLVDSLIRNWRYYETPNYEDYKFENNA